MSAAWWGREATPAQSGRMVRGPLGAQPQLLPPDVAGIREAVRDRIAAFTPDWTNQREGDAGVALVRLFAFELEPVLRRANRTPEQAFVEYLVTAGVRPLPATPAATLLQLTVSPAADGPVFVPGGMQAAAPPATGEGDLVTFETVAGAWATAAEIVELQVQEGGLYGQVELPEPDAPVRPFGMRARTGRALWVGISPNVPHGAAISLGVVVASPPGAPPPAAEGAVVPIPLAPAPLLRWEVLDGGTFVPAEVLVDESSGFARSGVIELGLPRRWRPSRPSSLGDGDERRWLRLRIVHGSFERPPVLALLFLNAVRAEAARTIRDEALEPVETQTSARTVMRVSQTPILARSLVLEVDEGVAADVFGIAEPGEEPSVRRWEEVDDLSGSGPDDRHFVLDQVSGEVTFGDGINGMRVPKGFRNVIARSYRVGGGAAGAVDADEVASLLTSVPFVTGVTNPVRASGGSDSEPTEQTVRRGPKEIRSRGRAVTTADYVLLAPRAPGASIARAHAVAGLHPAHPGLPVPGVVGVFVVPPDRGEPPPTPDQESLRSVARYLSSEVAPAGVEVVAAAPRYHLVRVEAQVVIDRAADPSTVVRRVVDMLDTYLHPLTGGESGQGWPFGGPLRYVPLVQRVLGASDAIRAVTRLDFVVDGVRVPPCSDYTLSPNSLIWPEGHEVIAEQERAA